MVKLLEDANYWQSCVSNDRKNNRSASVGHHFMSRTDSFCPLSNKNHCPFNFTIWSNKYGYFIKPWLGCFNLEGHAKMDPLRTPLNLISQPETELVRDMNSARAAPGHAVNLHFARTSRSGTPNLLTTSQVKHVMKMSNKDREDRGEKIWYLGHTDSENFRFFDVPY